ncbi:MAG: tetratricopeptide repeat protein [Bacteroidales bacterium]|nr:tetratricopeptide repeat protein [Bacteroidales bacterium]
MKNLYLPGSLAFLLIGLLTISSCSTKKNTFTRRVYHNLTSHYNVYWNGMDQLRQGVKEYQSTIVDNYSLVLPVYNYGDKANTATISQYSDIGITKASKTIQKHSMVFNSKEYVKWIDDAYLLIGKSYYYKQDYGMARRTFRFIIKTYNKNEIKYEAMLWLGMANVQMKDFKRAEPMLDMLLNKIQTGEAPEKFEGPINLAYAQFYILQLKYEAAIPYLKHGIILNPGHTLKTRCLFILGQIYQRNGDHALALGKFKSVIKRNASFEMEFNAKINMAQCYDTQTGDKEFIVKKLMRMLKDDKNKEHLDQIYYALAQVSLKDHDTISGIGYLAQSVTSSRGNNYQKAISALALANIYFIIPDYPLAQSYFDSTMQFLPSTFPNYKEIQRKTATLTDLVINLQIIQLQDSLQMMAALPEDERNRIIDEMIKQLVLEEQKRKIEEMERQENQSLFDNSDMEMSSVTGPRTGNWYFYNPTAMSNGFSAFAKKWGKRKLEDLWFLSDKNIISFDNMSEGDTTMIPGDTTGRRQIAPSSNPKKREFYLADLPLTQAKIDSSNDLVIDAYYNAGFIYIDGLKDYGNSIESFESLLNRFPTNKHQVPTYYELYILYGDINNQPKSDYYRNLILNQFAETDYAKLLINPDYYKEIQEKESKAAKLYQDTYVAFTNQQYYMVLHNYDEAITEHPGDTSLIPRFEYLRAMALGKVEVVDSLVVALQGIVVKYPTHEVQPLAINILEYLSKQRNAQGNPIVSNPEEPEDPSARLYSYYPGSIHFFILIVNSHRIDVNATKVKIADFNSKYFRLDELQVNSIVLDQGREMITVNNFYDAKKALDYYLQIRKSEYVYNKLENVGNYADFVISVENYPVFYKNKDANIYNRFFEKNYNTVQSE